MCDAIVLYKKTLHLEGFLCGVDMCVLTTVVELFASGCK